MNKTDLIQEVAKKTGLSKAQAGQAVNAALETMTEVLNRGEKVQIMGFGIFEPRHRPARRGHNPRNLKPVNISASRTVTFRAGNGLKGEIKE